MIEGMYISEEKGQEYRGTFKDLKMHGQGKLTFADGKVYEGDFVDGIMDGKGILCFNNKIYKGKFKNGKQHGIGVFYPNGVNGKALKGRWIHGKRIQWL